MPRYMELVERLENPLQLSGYALGPLNEQLSRESKEAAEAIRSLLSLVGEMAEAMKQAKETINLAWPHGYGSPAGTLAVIEYVLQKAREATGEAEASPATHGAES